MVSRRRSIGGRRIQLQEEKADTFGYFAEAFELDALGLPIQRISDPSKINKGLYERVEVSDSEEASARSLIPTNFFHTNQSHLKRQFKDLKMLSGENEPSGIMSALFATSGFHEEPSHRNIKEEIISRFYPPSNYQGLQKDIQNVHLIITSDGEIKASPIISLSQELGIKPHVATLDHLREEFSGITGLVSDPIGIFAMLHRARPLIVTVDMAAIENEEIEKNGRIEFLADPISRMLYYTMSWQQRSRSFFMIRIDKKREGEQVLRLSNGFFETRGRNSEVLRGLILKAGVDFALTKQVRRIANSLP